MAHSPTQALDVGSVIAETYTVEGLLGRGGMGAVFVASHVRLPGKKVAIKVLHPDVADAESLARFRREAESRRAWATPTSSRSTTGTSCPTARRTWCSSSWSASRWPIACGAAR